MPKPKKGPRFGGSPAHHDKILRNLATELFRHGRIQTTEARAKNVQPLAERLITFAKRGDLHARRQVQQVVTDRDVVHKLFADIGPAFVERDGGYTRVLRTGVRKGDGATTALIELVEGVGGGDEDLAEEPRRRWSLRRRSGATPSQSAQEAAEQSESAGAATAVAEPDEDPATAEADEATAEERGAEVEATDDDAAGDDAAGDSSDDEGESRA